ncbi:hypothetical protein JF541_19610 [Marinobacter hydrocarbonoclasticus]|uniref:hypothetical protein n=1 Tax=Marinobacter nauticus TaxID=2743 RepID=UPI001A8F1E41|nr:hypothetical protein [Marinobacter nauticus]MBN8241366.1 hypothetical protein [Marinobacter nauticus]
MGSLAEPIIFVDDKGVWRQDRVGDRKYGIAFDEIDSIYIGRMFAGEDEAGNDIFDEVVCLDFEFGEYIEIYSCWPGYDLALSELAKRYSELRDKYSSAKEKLVSSDEMFELWSASS